MISKKSLFPSEEGELECRFMPHENLKCLQRELYPDPRLSPPGKIFRDLYDSENHKLCTITFMRVLEMYHQATSKYGRSLHDNFNAKIAPFTARFKQALLTQQGGHLSFSSFPKDSGPVYLVHTSKRTGIIFTK